MKKKILLGLVLPIFLLAIFAEGALGAATSGKKSVARALRVDGAQPPGLYTGLSPVVYESGMQPNCDDINPPYPVVILQHEEWASTYYDYQQNGSMGRMIAVSCGGHKHMVCHETRGPYTTFPRYVTYNCKDPVSVWCGPMLLDGGPGLNSGYAQMLLMHHGLEVILFHRTAPPIGCWYSTLARGESVEDQGTCFIQKRYDLPDEHDYPQVATTPDGMWPKGAMVYDAITDSDYIHIVTTESPPEGEVYQKDEVYQSVAYQRCVFEATDIVCYAPHDPVYGPYRRSPGVYGDPDDNVAVFDYLTTISAIVTSSPVSKRVAIVYTKPRHHPEGGGCAQHNNDVVYIESMNNGDDWFAGPWPPPIRNVSNYPTDGAERAYTDVAACYDYNDSLHIVWNAVDFDSATCMGSNSANLMHWSKKTGISMIAPGYWGGTSPGAWNYNISKPSVSAKDPIYHPGGDPDSVYLFCTWTQFNEGDMSAAGWSNGDIYAVVSDNAGSTWTPGFNLTNTKTPDCAPGACLSEHWSSMAENMYDGDLHIEYVCDRDAGGVARNEGSWTETLAEYIRLYGLPANRHCGISLRLYCLPRSCPDPPLGVPLNCSKFLVLELEGLYNMQGHYNVTTDHEPEVTCATNCEGTLKPGEKTFVSIEIACSDQEEFIKDIITIHGCTQWPDDDTTIKINLHAICSDDDYYECDNDDRTYAYIQNYVLKLKTCANTEERVWDIWLDPNERKPVIFSGGVIVATKAGNDLVVGRQDNADTYTGARDTIKFVESPMEPYFEDEKCIIQKSHCEKTFICANHLRPPESQNHDKWWWISINQKIIMFRGPECVDWRKDQIIKYIWVKWSDVPGWWPDQSQYEEHEDIYVGVFADINAPADKDFWNTAGYDEGRKMIWQHGYSDGSHPGYEHYYVGMALTDPSGAVITPWGVQNVLQTEYLIRPGENWRWVDEELYGLAATQGVNIHYPDSVDDRAMVLTAGMIPAGNNPADLDLEFILIEAFIPNGLAGLQNRIDITRQVIIPELDSLGVLDRTFPICGDINEDGTVNVADAVYLVTYLFQYGPPPSWPMNRADVNGDGDVDVADLVYLVTYLFQYGPAPNCSGFGR